MKKKINFITNSSSTNFIISTDDIENVTFKFDVTLSSLIDDLDTDSYRIIDSVQSLDEYFQDTEIDNKEEYIRMKNTILNGGKLIQLIVDRNNLRFSANSGSLHSIENGKIIKEEEW